MPKPRQKRNRLDAATQAKLVQDYESGDSLGVVAKKYHVDPQTAARHLMVADVPIRPNPVKILPTDLPAIHQLRTDGWSLQAIADRYSCSAVAVANRLKRYEASVSGS
jgi:hypothetical protein